MSWIVFSYSLAAKAPSSPRVALWRRLQRLGAITPKAGVYVLPATEECVEAFQWLAQEVQQIKGEAVVMRVERFEGLSDQRLAELFRDSCREKYAEIESQATELENSLRTRRSTESITDLQEKYQRLHKRYAEVARNDFFGSPEGVHLSMQLRGIQQAFLKGMMPVPPIPEVRLADYRKSRLVTRPRPHVDRLGCAWLIRRFINPKAVIRYSGQPEPDEVAFDMRDGHFGHRGNLCTFETMVTAFRMKDPGLTPLAEIIHEIDLRDGRYIRPETPGVDRILKGWLLAGFSDMQLESHGLAMFEGLFASFNRGMSRNR